MSFRSNHGKEEDSYLASLSDLMVGMLFVFIIILMSFALKLRVAESKSEKEKTEVENLRTNLTQDNERRANLLQDIKSALEQQGVKVELDLKNGILRLPEKLLFDSGSADFSQSGKNAVLRLSQALAELLPCYDPNLSTTWVCPEHAHAIRLDVILIEGHTDNVPIYRREFQDNWGLSMARAHNTFEQLINSTSALSELRNMKGENLISMSAYADTRPVASNDSDSGRRQNRRIDLRFILATPEEQELKELGHKLQQ